jgi:hypothetical protein
MPTLLLSPRHGEDSRQLWRAAVHLGWDVRRVHKWEIPSMTTDDVAIYGEPLLCQFLSQRLNLTLDEPALDWLPNVPHTLRKRDVRLASLREARSITHRAFVKPAEEKGLEGKVYESGAELPVMTAAPYWLNGSIAQDKNHDWLTEVPESAEAASFCETVLTHPNVKHPHAFVLDVGETSDRGWAVIEANAAFSSGIYGNNPIKALEVIRQAARKK